MNITPNVLRAFAQAFQLVADALDQPQTNAAPVMQLAPAPVVAPVKAKKEKPAPIAKPAPVASDDDDDAPAPKANKPVASDDDDDAPTIAIDVAPAAKVDYAKLRGEAAALLVAYVDEHGMSKAAKILRKHGADKVSRVAEISLASLVAAFKAGEPE